MPVRAVVDWARMADLPVEEPLAQAGLCPQTVQDPWHRVRTDSLPGVLNAIHQHTGAADVGLHAGQHLSMQAYDLCGISFLAQHTPLEAAQEAARLYNIFTAVGRVALWQQEDTVWVQISDVPPELAGADQYIIFLLSQMLVLARACSAEKDLRCKAWIPAKRPRSSAPYEALFGDQVRFEQPEAMLAFPAEAMRARNPHANSERLHIVQRYVEMQQAQLSLRNGLAQRIRLAIRADLLAGQSPALPALARRLGFSPRTLQDHLQAERTSYAACLDATRGDLLLPLLAQSSPNLDDVSSALGFDDVASLHRFTKRRYGSAPGKLRRNLRLQS